MNFVTKEPIDKGCLQYIDGIPFKLKSAFDFSFIKEYGTVFKIYDDQSSGNICFAVSDERHNRQQSIRQLTEEWEAAL